ncbi:cation:proton antiporter [Reyranella sp.]|uniref:cation:proton antiporter domain-containing protein n=1 Tax=Reyranella sp. TaxID=1929291 RepID=UPI00272F2827|nr:cation:proton antiporter [Reyranella sp.]MDP2372931.1 cation:proton antiporter [Reyranella sp.]
MALLAVFIVLVFAYGLVSRRLEGTVVTGPIVFTVAGIVAGTVAPGALAATVSSHFFLHLAEIGLVLLLFTDAGRTDLSLLWNIRDLPARLLAVGLPLTILLGTVAAGLVFPNLTLWEAAILAAILAPTDAGLGQIVVTSPRAPLRVRQALNVEAGLNDGLSVPFLLFFIALASASEEGTRASFTQFVVEQLGYGVAVGAAIGLVGGWLLGGAARRDWISGPFRQCGVVALPLLCLLVSDVVAASMFIAAFVAGLAVQKGFRDAAHHSLEFSEIWGQIINLSVFFLFGMIVARDWSDIDLAIAAYAVLSLTVVRLVPVALSLIGSGLGRATVLFMGWFGPRGLASIVLGLVYLEQEFKLPGESTIRLATIATVLLSIFSHGLSAQPGIALYARRVAALAADAPERRDDKSITLIGRRAD